jgi:hypothetical protein
MLVTAGDTDVTTYFMVRSSTNGTAATGLTATTFDLQYTRTAEEPSTKADGVALAATNSAHTDNGIIEIDATNSPGLYRVDWPDAAFAEGVSQVFLSLKYSSAIFTEVLAVDIDPLIDGTITREQALKILLAEAAGVLNRSGTTITMRNQADTKNVITATVDTIGQRSEFTLDLT